MKKIKNEKGSITLFVLMSMLFFMAVLIGLYISSSYKIQAQERETEQIQKNYETENIDNLYNSIATVPSKYTAITTYEELQEKINNENEKYIVLEKDIETSNELKINHTVTIDLNGHTYSINEQNNKNNSIIVTGINTELTIKDTSKSKNGCIITKNTDTEKKMISIENNAKLILDSGAISNDDLNYKNTQIINISENSEFVMNEGTIIGKIIQEGIAIINSGKIIGDIYSNAEERLSIQGGVIKGNVIIKNR